MMTTDAVRAAAIESGESVRNKVALLPQSDSRDEMMALLEQMREFWETGASDEFCRQWLFIALSTNGLNS